jgi:hypothetical protein
VRCTTAVTGLRLDLFSPGLICFSPSAPAQLIGSSSADRQPSSMNSPAQLQLRCFQLGFLQSILLSKKQKRKEGYYYDLLLVVPSDFFPSRLILPL